MKLFAVPLVLLSIAACGADGMLPPITAPAVADADLFALAQPITPWTYYKRSAVPVKRASSAHTESHALVRYNALAATQLDASGKVRVDA
ncbi:MAG: hypothetical protein ABJB74_08560, partial [Gemmatimonas sp.]